MDAAPSTDAVPFALAGFLLLLFGLAYGAVLLAPSGSRVASRWPAAGLAVGVLATTRRRQRLTLLVGVLVSSALANLAGARPALVCVGCGLINAAEAGLGSW